MIGASELSVGIREKLTFVVTGRSEEGIQFEARYSSFAFSGRVESSTYLTQPPSRFFAALANDWRSEQTWQDLEGALVIRATGDSTGHVTLHVKMRDIDRGLSISGSVSVELGQLEAIAAAMRRMFGFDTLAEHRAWLDKAKK